MTINIPRLQVLANHLRTPEVAEHWNYGFVLCGKSNNPSGCGTSGCALGHALAISEFGLRAFEAGNNCTDCWGITDHEYNLEPKSHVQESIESAIRVFGLNQNQASRIFLNAHFEYSIRVEEVSPAMVADLIDRVIAEV